MLPALLLAALAASAPPTKPVVTVLYFDNNTGHADFDVLRKGLADMIITDLVAWDGVSVVEREKLESVFEELKLQKTKHFDPATAVKVGKLIGAHYLLTGAIGISGEELRLDARLIEAERSKVVATASARGPKDKVFDIEQELVDQLTAGIDLKVKNVAARRRVKVPNLDSLLQYSKALDLSDQGKIDEAQKAMQLLVSRSPTFLMAREKKEQILKRLQELEARRADIITQSALQLAALADAALAEESKLDSLDEKAQRRFMSMRVVKGKFILRLLKQHVSWRRKSVRVILKGHEAKALELMRAWLANQKRLLDEYERYRRQRSDRWPRVELEPEVVNLLREARMAEVRLSDPLEALLRFVVEGHCLDSDERWIVAPALGDLDPKEREAAFGLLDARIETALANAAGADAASRRSAELAAIRLLELKAEALLALGRDEDAIGAFQQIPDAFPADDGNERRERRIRQLIGAAHDDRRSKRERWAKAMGDGCADDMDLRVASGTVMNDRMKRMGLAALKAHADELERSCKPTGRNRGGFAAVYRDLALEAANHEDCEGFREWFRRYVEVDGSIGDMMGYQKNHTPWCELGDVVKSVLWFTARLDGSWNFELDRHLTSVLSYDGKRLSLSGGREQGPESLSLYLDTVEPGTFRCASAHWQRADGTALEGGCTVRLSKLAAEPGDFDEGEFSATFEQSEPVRRTMTLTEGRFRVRRR
ncbi:MAG: CsgG/HfaB family protein [Myxococcales bacterium]